MELADRAKFTHLSDVLKGAIKSSLLKAVEQGQEVRKNLGSAKDCTWGVESQAGNYLFVVTYKSLYIGNASFLVSFNKRGGGPHSLVLFRVQ